MFTYDYIVKKTVESECFKAEVGYCNRGGYQVETTPRLYKELEDDLVRVVFPVVADELEEGTVLAVTCLYDKKEDVNIYAHTICAGPGVNVLLKSIHSPLGQAKPRPGVEGDKVVLHFVEWKKAAWGKFLNDELELGAKPASQIFVRNFWLALDRMFGGGYLIDYPQPKRMHEENVLVAG